MMNRIICIGAIVLAFTAPVAGREDAAAILARADAFRGGFDSSVIRVKLTNYDGDAPTEEAEYEVSAKGENSLVKFLSVRSKGQALLMRGDDMWFFLPAVARPVRITPIQRLLGNVANGDLARLRYALDYTAAVEGHGSVEGTPATILDLRAKRRGATYQRVRYFVRQSDAQPLRAEYFLTSGKAVKSASFGEPRQMAGRTTLTRIVVRDAVRTSSRTTIEIMTIVPRELPDKMFSPVRAGG